MVLLEIETNEILHVFRDFLHAVQRTNTDIFYILITPVCSVFLHGANIRPIR